MNTRRFKVIGLLTAVVLMFSACGKAGTLITYKIHKPRLKTSGTIHLSGLQGITSIVQDKWGVRHVFAENENDMYFAMGYIQAQDRLFQMDIARRCAQGRLAEILGDLSLPETPSGSLFQRSILQQDILMRRIGLSYAGKMGEALLPPEDLEPFKRFADGVNAFLDHVKDKLPIEFKLLDYYPERWTVADSIAVARLLAWSLSQNARAELIRYATAAKTDPAAAMQLLPLIDNDPPYIIPSDQKQYNPASASIVHDSTIKSPLTGKEVAINIVLNLLGAIPDNPGEGHASNNWVLAGSRTNSGKPMLSNDPHLDYDLPSPFYLAHLKCQNPEIDVIGGVIPGLPFIVAGHNRHVAWGVTTTNADTQDIFIEKTDPNHSGQYLYKDQWENFVVAEHEFKVKVSEGDKHRIDIKKIKLRYTRHGSVISDCVDPNTPYPVVLRWAGFDFLPDPDSWFAVVSHSSLKAARQQASRFTPPVRGNDSLALRKLSMAKTADDAIMAISFISAPIQNWVVADDSGNIGYIAAGFIPVRKHGDGTFPAPGWTGEFDWIGFIPVDELPRIMNPPEGFVATANNQVVPKNEYPYPLGSDFASPYRAARIRQIILAFAKSNVEDMLSIQLDTYSLLGNKFASQFADATRKKAKAYENAVQIADMLDAWDHDTRIESNMAPLFYMTYQEFYRRVYEPILEKQLTDAVFASQSMMGAVDIALSDTDNPVFNKARNDGKTRDDLMAESVIAAFARIKGLEEKNAGQPITWGDVHTITLTHPMGAVKGLSSFNIGPRPWPGSIDTVKAAFFRPFDPDFKVIGGATFRHIVDLSDPVKSAHFVISSGQSGWPGRKHYSDMAQIFLQDSVIPCIMDRQELATATEGVLNMFPKTEGTKK